MQILQKRFENKLYFTMYKNINKEVINNNFTILNLLLNIMFSLKENGVLKNGAHIDYFTPGLIFGCYNPEENCS